MSYKIADNLVTMSVPSDIAMDLWSNYNDQFVPSSMPSQSKYWMFVLWPNELSTISDQLEMSLTANTPCGRNSQNKIVAVRMQEEVSPNSGKTHVQGWIQFEKRARKSTLEDLIYWDRQLCAIPCLVPEAGYWYC